VLIVIATSSQGKTGNARPWTDITSLFKTFPAATMTREMTKTWPHHGMYRTNGGGQSPCATPHQSCATQKHLAGKAQKQEGVSSAQHNNDENVRAGQLACLGTA
jgi:hypothetical protein